MGYIDLAISSLLIASGCVGVIFAALLSKDSRTMMIAWIVFLVATGVCVAAFNAA